MAGHRHGRRIARSRTFGRTEIAVPRARIFGAGGKTAEWQRRWRLSAARTQAADALIASAYLSATNTRPPGAGNAAVAKVPSLRIAIVKRSDARLRPIAPPSGRRENLLMVRTQSPPRPKDWENLAETLTAFIELASIQIASRRLARSFESGSWGLASPQWRFGNNPETPASGEAA
jgi:hypothetical protein